MGLDALWPLIMPVLSQEQVLQGEIAALRAQLSEREDALQSMAERLRSTAQLKDSMEQFIVSQCTWPGWHNPAAGWHSQAGLVPKRLGWPHSTGTSPTPISLSLAVTRTHNVLRKARTNLEVSLPWHPGQNGASVPVLVSPGALGTGTDGRVVADGGC